MAIVYLGNFYGIEAVNTSGSNVLMSAAKSQFIQFYTAGLNSRIGRHDTIPNKSVISIKSNNSLVSGNFRLGGFFGLLGAERTPVGTEFIIGFRISYTGGAASMAFTTIIPSLVGSNAKTLYKDVVYSVEIKYVKTILNVNPAQSDTYTAQVYVNKELLSTTTIGGINPTSDGTGGPSYSFLAAGQTLTTVSITDIYLAKNLPTDIDKTPLIGPLDIRHYPPTIATDVNSWTVVDGSAQSVPVAGATVLQALADNEVGITNQAAMTVAMTDPSGSVAKFKFDNVPLGDYLAYSVDMYANQPQSQSGDLETEVFLPGQTTPAASKLVTGVIKTPGSFQLVNAITDTNPITGATLRNVEVAIGSKRIVPA